MGEIALILETNRLLLRDWDEEDIDDLVEGLNNIEVSRWLAQIPFPYTRQDARRYIEYCMKAKDGQDRDSFAFAIELKAEKKVIGGTSIERIDRHHGTAGGGIWINEKYHRQGYGTEAFGKRVEFAFNGLGLRRLENGFFDGNPTSFILQEKFGYVIEGTRRKRFLCRADNQLKDETITGLLKEEWTNRSF